MDSDYRENKVTTDPDTLEQRIEQSAREYYEGTPSMSDDEYDLLVDQLKAQTGEEQVAGGYVPRSSRKTELDVPMLSLGKIYDRDHLITWSRQFSYPLVVDYKWDGLSAQVVVENKRIVRAVTRGNGYIGENVTETVSNIDGIDDIIDSVADHLNQDAFVLVGEVVLSRGNLDELNEIYGLGYSNPRNGAAGILNRRDNKVEYAKRLSFIPHESELRLTDDLTKWQGYTVHSDGELNDALDSIETAVNSETREYDADGAVIKALDPDERDNAGSSNTSPNWAVAYKYSAQEYRVELHDVTWSTGRTGRIIPVAHFTPTPMGVSQSVVSRATLHNASIFERFAPHEGDTLVVKKSGDVIPYIVDSESAGNEHGKFTLPATCPNCGAEAERSGEDIICTATGCNLIGSLTYAISVLGVEYISARTIISLVDQGIVTSDNFIDAIFEMRTLRVDDLDGAYGFGPVAARNFVENMKVIDQAYLHSWIASLGIKGIGRRMGLKLSLAFDSDVERVLDATVSEIATIDGFGPSRAETFVNHHDMLRRLVDRATEHGIDVNGEEDVEAPEQDTEWFGLNIVLTGKLPNDMSRGDASDWLVARGATIQGTVNGKTDLLIAGEKAGSKLKKAESLGTRIMSGEEFSAKM